MSVAVMKKISVVTIRKEASSLIRSLQHLRCIDIQSAACDDGLQPPDMSSIISEINEKSAIGARAVDFLSSYYDGKRSLFTQMKEISLADFEKDRSDYALEIAKKACDLAARFDAANAKLNSLSEKYNALSAWSDYPLPLRDCKTKYTVTIPGSFPPSTDIKLINEKLSDLPCVIIPITDTPGGMSVSLTVHRKDLDDVLRIVTSFGFTRCQIASAHSPAKEIAECKKSLEAVKTEIEDIKSEARNLAASLDDVETLCDKLSTDLARAEAMKKLALTDSTVILTGWIPEKQVENVKKLLDERGDAYSFTDPEEGDDVPVLLSNNPFASRFEPVIALYSLPAYGTFDPTFVMSFFYLAIFGLMFADVGYGLILTAGCVFMLLKMSMGRTMRMMVGMFAMCGIASMVCGVLFGGYFGDMPTVIMKTFFGIENPPSIALWFDPVNNTIMFLVVSLGCGVIHLLAGLLIKAYIMITKKDYFGAIFDVGSWIVLFAGIGFIFINQTVGFILCGIGAISLIATQGRAEKNIIMKFLKGLLSLYDIVNYFSDLLSYSRILSLALSSAIIANVVNMLGTLPGPGFGSVVGIILAALVGHTLNIAINVLGTFVHTSRLQYIEFFGKFYEDGGTAFVPLTPHSKYVTFN